MSLISQCLDQMKYCSLKRMLSWLLGILSVFYLLTNIAALSLTYVPHAESLSQKIAFSASAASRLLYDNSHYWTIEALNVFNESAIKIYSQGRSGYLSHGILSEKSFLELYMIKINPSMPYVYSGQMTTLLPTLIIPQIVSHSLKLEVPQIQNDMLIISSMNVDFREASDVLSEDLLKLANLVHRNILLRAHDLPNRTEFTLRSAIFHVHTHTLDFNTQVKNRCNTLHWQTFYSNIRAYLATKTPQPIFNISEKYTVEAFENELAEYNQTCKGTFQ